MYNNDHTPDRGADGTVDQLRKLIVDYIACEIDNIGECREFVDFMEDGGEFVGDFWGIAKHLVIPQHRHSGEQRSCSRRNF